MRSEAIGAAIGKTFLLGVFGYLFAMYLGFVTAPAAPPAAAPAIDEDRAIRAIIGEAEGEGYAGMYAVACAIRNRGTLKGVEGEQSRRVLRAPGTLYQRAGRAWAESEYGADVTYGATHWENVRAFGVPNWSRGMCQVAEVGRHVFWKECGHAANS